jgi:hypothetical protein
VSIGKEEGLLGGDPRPIYWVLLFEGGTRDKGKEGKEEGGEER